MSKLEVLTHDILTNEEMTKYNISIEIVVKENILAICLRIPKFSNISYHKALIIPMPNTEKHEIDIEITEILMTKSEIFEIPKTETKENKLTKHTNICIKNNFRTSNNIIITKNFECTEIEIV